MLSATSRYREIETAKRKEKDGRETVYLRRRFLPRTDNITLLAEHSVAEGERLDHIAAQHLGNPERFWQICDANNAMHPEEMTDRIGRKLKIPIFCGGE